MVAGSLRLPVLQLIEDDMTTRQITTANADELMEQREQNQACLNSAESRQKKTEGQKIKQLYETAFPEDEQIPWKDLMRLI